MHACSACMQHACTACMQHACNACMLHACKLAQMHACSACMQRMHAEHACRACMQSMHAACMQIGTNACMQIGTNAVHQHPENFLVIACYLIETNACMHTGQYWSLNIACKCVKVRPVETESSKEHYPSKHQWRCKDMKGPSVLVNYCRNVSFVQTAMHFRL